MIVKPLVQPKPLRQLEVLMQRTPRDHTAFPELEASYHKRRAGYYGEQSLTYIFKRFFHNAYVLQDLRLPSLTGGYFQIDALILTPQHLFLLEVKHLKGTVHLESPHGLLTRELDGTVEQFPNPLLQLQNTSEQLKIWAKNMRLPKLKVHHIAVFTHSNCILQRPKGALLLRPDEIFWSIKHYIQNRTEDTELCQIWSDTLIQAHTPAPPAALNRLGITRSEISGGVWCSDCSKLTMRWERQRWRCTKCKHSDAKGHIAALQDFFTLSEAPFSNADIQHFLDLPRSATVRRFLYEVGCERLPKPKSHLYTHRNIAHIL
ncbi:nuclease-like protein [Salsuginibacillus halophilus]|uniref:Nuclease-like protein n=1 Tax=Salsuginibacillus halophilus TaxID=517424 RepID=A0A2P8HI13_9BACI|nr:nuclease-like protein [Salsuginibacillus halophilus]